MSHPAETLRAMEARIPYASFLGVMMALSGDEVTATLPYSDHLIGSPAVPAIHGGVLGALLELTALAQLCVAQKLSTPPPPIGVTVEYLRPGRAIDTFARAKIRRVGRRIANVTVEAWQETRSSPIACLYGRFLMAPLLAPPAAAQWSSSVTKV